MVLAASIILAVFALAYLVMALCVVSGRMARQEELDAEIREALARWSSR